jgi:hypothetical protein
MKNYAKIWTIILTLAQAIVWARECASSQAGRAEGEGAALEVIGESQIGFFGLRPGSSERSVQGTGGED